jgi:hypothetical protein
MEFNMAAMIFWLNMEFQDSFGYASAYPLGIIISMYRQQHVRLAQPIKYS